MNIAFYIDEMNLRGVANQTFLLAINNKKILKNNSIIFYNKKNNRNNKEVIKKFKKKFTTIGISEFKDIDKFKKKYRLKFLYTQKSGNIDNWQSENIKTLVHAVYPQKLNQIHGYNYAYVSDWLSEKFSNKKIPAVSYMIDTHKTKKNLKKKLNIEKNKIVFGCHGGESSFDLKFTHDVIKNIVVSRKDIFFIFLNIKKFYHHKQIKFLKGTLNENYKKKFINSCDAMIYGRSLGESFGLSIGEFAIENKRIISYKFNRHRAHCYSIPNNQLIEYNSYNSLIKIILNFKKKSLNIRNKYKEYTKNKVIKNFQNTFLKKEQKLPFSLWDYLKNYKNFIEMSYYYLRHKIYEHYFNFFESKFL